MNRDGRSSSNDPTGEAAADPAVQLRRDQPPGTRPADPAVRNREDRADRGDVDPSRGQDDDIVNRHTADATPRRYERPVTDDEDPVLPAGDATLNTQM